MDKENERTHKKSMKPPNPLSPLSENSLNKYRDAKEERHPLQTLYNERKNKECAAGTSNSRTEQAKHEKRKGKYLKAIDTRYVTVRQKHEDLDWNYEVFNEDVHHHTSHHTTCFNESRCSNSDGETSKASTPVPKSPLKENFRIRNIKKSLKRPHSRELQGISPIASIKKGEEKHKRKLYFTQTLQANSQPPDFWKKSYTTCLNKDYTKDIFNYLLNKEFPTMMPKISTDTRACIINWLLKVNGPEGNPAVIQKTRWYFDSVLTVGEVSLDKMQSVATACYWISMKIHGHVQTAKKLVAVSSNAFSSHTLLAAERAILRKLKFPAQPITSQEFITYLSWYCDEKLSSEIELIATIMCIAGLMVNKALCNEYPSVVGAAAVRNAIYVLKNSLLWAKLQKSSVYKEAEKKTPHMSYICALQRHGIRRMSSPSYGYKALLEHYGTYPYCVSQRIISFANECASIDEKSWLV